MKRLPIVFIWVLILACSRPASAQINDTVRNYLDSAIYIMQTKSLFGKELDWDKIRDSAYQISYNAQSIPDAFPAFTYAFQQLNDHHGMIANQDTFYREPYPEDLPLRLSQGIKDEFLKGNRFVNSFLPGNIGYIRVPSMPGVVQKDIDYMANRLRDTLCMTLGNKPSGLILDLRMNAGGNSVPMQSGLGPVFGNGVVGYNVDRDGNFIEEIRLSDGISIDQNGNKMANVRQTCQPDVDLPIAVLIGPATGSSGEILAAFLKPLPNIRLFGEPTAGFCNATEGFFFMEKKGYMLLTVNKMADFNKHIYEDMTVHPDEYIKSLDNYIDLIEDQTVKAAMEWLNMNAL